MRTLFVGAGATGGYFGGRLAAAGRDVTFLVRPGRAQVLASRGLRVVDGAETITTAVRTVTAPVSGDVYDLVVLAVKTYHLEQALRDMAPAVGPSTVIVPLLNGMRHVDRLVGEFGPERTWGGTCLIQSTLSPEGDVIKMTGMHRLGYGPLDGAVDSRLPLVTEALSGEEFDTHPSLTIVQDMWEKWTLLAALGGATTLMRGTFADINSAPGGTAFTSALAAEASAIAAAAGHPQRSGAAALLAASVATLKPNASSMYRDMVAGLPVEADAILGDFVAEAQKHGVAAPLLAAAYTALAVYSTKRSA